MATTSKRKYEEIKVIGPVSVAPVDGTKRSSNWRTVLVMGPTGSGKSSFIEALGLKGTSKISSHSLDACTQTVSTYILNNVTRRGDPIYLVDSPGFADTKISEMAITSMLQKWIQDNGYFNYILYLTPITQVRLPGSQRQILKTFNALTGIKSARNVMVVATMWDTIYAEHVAKRAEETYKQLQDDIWEDFIQRGGRISQFHNTEQSVLSILDQVFGLGDGHYFSVEEHKGTIKGSPFETNLLADLQMRIQNLDMDLGTIRRELIYAEERGDQQLQSFVLRNLQETEQDLVRFRMELDSFYAIPLPRTSSEDENDAGDVGESSDDHEENSDVIPSVIPHLLPPISAASPVAPTPDLLFRPVSQPQQLGSWTQHTPVKIMRFVKSMKCWGKNVGERHEA